jgi:threonine aldolase
MVFFRWQLGDVSDVQFLERCVERGVRFSHVGSNRFRAVTHMDVTREDMEKAAEIVGEICG